MARKPLVLRDRITKLLIPYYVKGEDVLLNDGTYLEAKLADIIGMIGTGGYTPPPTGIPADDLAGNIPLSKLSSTVQQLLALANTALQEQTQADWDEENSSSPAFIQHKPEIPEGVEVAQSVQQGDTRAVAGGAVYNELQGKANATTVALLRESLDAITGGDTTTAIRTFNEVVTFLANIEDTETLEGIIAGLQTEINKKYTKPQAGIPASDLEGNIPAGKLSQDVQTSLGKANTALQQSDKTSLQGAIDAVQTALNNLVNGQSVSDSIDTFTKVVNFLSGFTTDEPVLKTQIQALSGAISTLQEAIQNVYTQTQADGKFATLQQLGGKQDKLTFDDAPGNTDNPVKSRGIKQAIDFVTPTIDANGKWVIGGVTTDKDAQGPRGNTVLVNENAQGIQALIVNNVVDGGETDILSAEMGKVIRQNIMRIFNALGTYAFPEGKPILNWGSTVVNYSINVNGVTGGLTISDVEVDGVSAASLPAQIVGGKSLSLKLNLPTGMYVFDGVAITMGGVAITNNTGVWDESTGTIYIASVTDDISITAAAVLDPINNYAEQSHLVFQLDGLHKGPTAGKWTDLKGGVVWDNHGATELSDCWQFDGSSYLDSQNMVAHEPRTCTIEVVIDSGLTNTTYHVFTDGSKMVLNYTHNYQSQDLWISRGHTNSTGYGGISVPISSGGDTGYGKKIVSVTGNNQDTFGGKVNGQSRNAVSINYGVGAKALIGGQWGSTSNAFALPFTGKVYAIRIYDTILTEAQILANQRLDNQRFNLGLTI